MVSCGGKENSLQIQNKYQKVLGRDKAIKKKVGVILTRISIKNLKKEEINGSAFMVQ